MNAANINFIHPASNLISLELEYDRGQQKFFDLYNLSLEHPMSKEIMKYLLAQSETNKQLDEFIQTILRTAA